MARTKGAKGAKNQIDAEYWERRLCEEGLSIEAGTSKRISYVGGVQTLDFIAGVVDQRTRDKSGDRDISYAPKENINDPPNSED